MIAQRYIKTPLLKNGYKFDLSIYIVVIGFNPIQAYICDEGLAKFCTAPYEAPERSNFKKAYMHLTNHIINMQNEDYVHPEETDLLLPNDSIKRTLNSLYTSLEEDGIDVS